MLARLHRSNDIKCSRLIGRLHPLPDAELQPYCRRYRRECVSQPRRGGGGRRASVVLVLSRGAASANARNWQATQKPAVCPQHGRKPVTEPRAPSFQHHLFKRPRAVECPRERGGPHPDACLRGPASESRRRGAWRTMATGPRAGGVEGETAGGCGGARPIRSARAGEAVGAAAAGHGLEGSAQGAAIKLCDHSPGRCWLVRVTGQSCK